MYGKIPEECDDGRKVMGGFSSFLAENRIFYLLCEHTQERNFKCTIGATYAHTGKYL